MNNFSELLDTDLKIVVELELEPILQNGPPFVSVKLQNSQLWEGWLETGQTLQGCVPLTSSLNIEIVQANKIYNQSKETATVIKHLRVDGFDLIPDHMQDVVYDTDQGPHPGEFYLGFNGHWKLHIPKIFYQWKHVVTSNGWLLMPELIELDL